MRRPYKSVPATKIKNAFGTYLAAIRRNGEPLLIERHGKPIAVLIDARSWDEMIGKAKPYISAWVEEARALSEEIRRTQKKPQTSAVEIIRQLREES